MPVEDRFWTHRLRWRMRGAAWVWPAFALAVFVDAAILHFLPPVSVEQQISGPSPLNLVGDLLVAGFANLFLVAAVAPWLGRRLAARPAAPGEAKPPLELYISRAAVTVMAAGAFGLVVVGLGNRPVIVSETEATETNAEMIRNHVLTKGTPEMKRNLETANTTRLSADFFRTCIAMDNRRKAFCFFVDTKADPPTLRRDPDERPNAVAYPR